MSDVGFDLAAIFSVVASCADAFTLAHVATHEKACVVRNWAAIAHVIASAVKVHAFGNTDRAAFFFTCFVNEVQDRARGVTSEC